MARQIAGRQGEISLSKSAGWGEMVNSIQKKSVHIERAKSSTYQVSTFGHDSL